MKLTRTLAAVCTAAAAAVVFSAGGAAADDDLLSALNNPAIGAACLPSGQAGVGNTVNGTQNISCNQSTSQDITNPTPPADSGATGWEAVSAASAPVAPGQFGGAGVQCPLGKIATGGGQQFRPFESTWDSTESNPTEAGNGQTGWQVRARNTSAVSGTVFARAVCVDGNLPA
ncbi:hypothetical protein [Streptomyces sp. NBC_00091]|uniref:hypothetical protein n=1 Tax=Streptomyces sp. NBC_00091 TaxID=2975648 RepID=UPI002252C102|nr:hypothetical protein [Streptomyces sp. NBC_00091]MCX5378594.1 hypothetical protein [Streptomyces sp. NBC_00091]